MNITKATSLFLLIWQLFTFKRTCQVSNRGHNVSSRLSYRWEETKTQQFQSWQISFLPKQDSECHEKFRPDIRGKSPQTCRLYPIQCFHCQLGEPQAKCLKRSSSKQIFNKPISTIYILTNLDNFSETNYICNRKAVIL